MKKKIILGLGICLISFSLFGCSKENQDLNTEQTDNVEISTELENISNEEDVYNGEDILVDIEVTPIPEEEINNEEYIFYACLSTYIEEFDRNYTLIGTAIDDNDVSDFNYYLKKLTSTIDKVEELNEPSSMKNAKEYIIASLKTYKNASIKLKDAYSKADYTSYNEFFTEIEKAQEFTSKFYTYCENFEDYSNYLSAIMETSFYMNNYNLYSKNSLFTEEENEILYILNHNIVLLPELINKTFLTYDKTTFSELSISEIKEVLNLLNSLEISDENLNMFRNELCESLDIYINHLYKYFEGLSNDSLENNFKDALEISQNAQRLYDSMLYMQKFYNEHDLNIDFTPTSDYIDIESSYELDVTDEGIEVIDESHTIIE